MNNYRYISLILIVSIAINTITPVNAATDIIVPSEYRTIQSAINAANPGDTILVRPGIYIENLEINKQVTIKGDGTGNVIIDGSGDFNTIHITAKYVQLQNLTIQNAVYGIYLSNADYTHIQDCTIQDCTNDGVSAIDSRDIWIQDTKINNCQDGVYLINCDRAWITGVNASSNYNGVKVYLSTKVFTWNSNINDNTNDGVTYSRCKESVIESCTLKNNNGDGVSLRYSEDISVTKSTTHNNTKGIYAKGSKDCYVSKTNITNNNDGVYTYNSDGTVVNSLIQYNLDAGVDSWRSQLILKYCEVSMNNQGADSYESTINAQNCWWGDPSGPYHPDYNPTGTGNKVDSIIFEPWQNTLYHPDALLSDLKYLTFTMNWKTVYPTQETDKPLDTNPAMVSDWLSSAYITTKLESYLEGTDLDPGYVNQETGESIGLEGEGILSFGGPIVNPVVKYAEMDTTGMDDRAPIAYYGLYDVNYFLTREGAPIPNAMLPEAVINEDQDMFVIELYMDSKGCTVLLCYGFGWQGTYAAGKYFETVLAPELENHPIEWIIVKWSDTNANGFVNTPNEGDTYTLIATG